MQNVPHLQHECSIETMWLCLLLQIMLLYLYGIELPSLHIGLQRTCQFENCRMNKNQERREKMKERKQ